MAGEGARLLGFRDSEEVEEIGRVASAFLPPLPPRARFGVADREPGGVSPGEEVADPAGLVVVEPNSSSRLSSYLRCFSSRSFTARALCSSMVGLFFSSASSEDTSPLASLDAWVAVFLESNIGGGLKSALGTIPRVSRK
jgi:hypothetical protein